MNRKYKIGETLSSRNHGEFVIIDILEHARIIKFKNTGNVKKTSLASLSQRTVADVGRVYPKDNTGHEVKFVIGSEHETLNGLWYTVIGVPSHKRRIIKFAKSGHIKECSTCLLYTRTVADNSAMKYAVGSIHESNKFGLFRVIGIINAHDRKVEFIDTGYITTTRISNINDGLVRDREQSTGKYRVGATFTNNDGHEYKIIKHVIGSTRRTIMFTDTMNIREASLGSIYNGRITDKEYKESINMALAR